MARIAISYRRSDTIAVTGRLFDRLELHYGRERVFVDIDAIPIGTDFRHHIDRVLGECDLVLVVMGRDWVGTLADGRRRIDDPADFVRIEAERALAREIPVVPVLVDSAEMPRADTLPESLQPLAYRNAADLDSGRDFHSHVDRLIRAIDAILPQSASVPEPAPPSTPPVEEPPAAVDPAPPAPPNPTVEDAPKPAVGRAGIHPALARISVVIGGAVLLFIVNRIVGADLSSFLFFLAALGMGFAIGTVFGPKDGLWPAAGYAAATGLLVMLALPLIIQVMLGIASAPGITGEESDVALGFFEVIVLMAFASIGGTLFKRATPQSRLIGAGALALALLLAVHAWIPYCWSFGILEACYAFAPAG